MYINNENEKFLEKFFENHKVFLCKDLHWGYFCNMSNNNIRKRIQYLFSEHGFFNYILEELDKISKIAYWPHVETGDNPDLHCQQRYICQEIIDDNIFNPIHTSLKTKTKQKTYNLTSPRLYKTDMVYPNLMITTHPGHTRMVASSFLKKNLTNSLIYINKQHYYENMISGDLEEITNVNQLFPLWKPYKKVNPDLIQFSFILNMSDSNVKGSTGLIPLIKNSCTKYHKETESFVLKLWNMTYYDENKNKDMSILHTPNYLQEVYKSSQKIAETLFEKRLTIYTNSKEDVKNYFLDIRKNLIEKATGKYKKDAMNFLNVEHWHKLKDNIKKHFDFDVVVVEDKPNDISKLNENKGFAIWIDKSILKDINREIYEFVVFARHDIKLSETEDGKISITNCKNIGDKKWIIHKEFYS
tara:strand:+ start:1028 stop:2269 length:1242 start_codon:yes stop_codon:yes gene_type:complete